MEEFYIAEKGEELLIYAFVSDGEYVKVNDKAYSVSGMRAPCVLHAEYKDRNSRDYLLLKDVDFPRDGESYYSSIYDLFPHRYYLRYRFSGVDGPNMGMELTEKVQNEWRVEVSDDLLMMDEEKKTYTIERVREGTDENGDYYFDTEIIEEGELK